MAGQNRALLVTPLGRGIVSSRTSEGILESQRAEKRQISGAAAPRLLAGRDPGSSGRDRKSTRLNSSHSQISYAVFCLKKKKKEEVRIRPIVTPGYVPTIWSCTLSCGD